MIAFLCPFYQITQQLQGNVALTAAIPCYNELFDHVEDWRDNIQDKIGRGNRSETERWKMALERCRDVLTKYYVKTDSKLYSGVTYCDPRMRTRYWDQANYEPVWKIKAMEHVRSIYESKYYLHGAARTQQSKDEPDDSDSVWRIMKPAIIDNGDEMSAYERGPLADCDPLSWWKLHATAFPWISMMAQDMLGVPATTASAERTFSQAKLLLTDQRNRIDPVVAGQLVCIGSWMRTFDLDFA
jgi:hAT family C-terminal dimerisation region